MSRVRTPFSDTGEDAFLPSIEQDDGLYDTCRDLFGDQSTPIFSTTFDKDGLDDLDLAPGDGTNAPQNSRTTSGTVTPEQEDTLKFSGYDFEPTQQSTFIYPAPNDLTVAMHLYPTHLQKPSTIYHKGDRRPLPHRSTTNTDIRLAPSPLQTFHQAHNHPSHRRSYSQNDTERILEYPIGHLPPGIHYPPYNHPHNTPTTTPTFVRLCETRNPRTTSKPRADPRKKTHTQSTPSTRNRALPPMSIPVGIGVPLHPDLETPVLTDGPVQLTGPRITHMAHSTQRTSSQKIIELGAMAVLNKLVKEGRTTIDPVLLEAKLSDREGNKSVGTGLEVDSGTQSREKMLRDLERMERVLEGEGEEGESARRGCEVIRVVLEKMEDKSGGGEEKRDEVVVRCEGSPDGESSLSEGDEEFMRRLVEGSPSG